MARVDGGALGSVVKRPRRARVWGRCSCCAEVPSGAHVGCWSGTALACRAIESRTAETGRLGHAAVPAVASRCALGARGSIITAGKWVERTGKASVWNRSGRWAVEPCRARATLAATDANGTIGVGSSAGAVVPRFAPRVGRVEPRNGASHTTCASHTLIHLHQSCLIRECTNGARGDVCGCPGGTEVSRWADDRDRCS